MYVRIDCTHIKVKGTMDQEEISIEKIKRLIRAHNDVNSHLNPYCAYTEVLYFQPCVDCPYRFLPCWCLLGTEKYILK